MSDPVPSNPPFSGPVGDVEEPGLMHWLISFAAAFVLMGLWLLFVRWWSRRHPGPVDDKRDDA